jgi:dTDP-4-amino-4,6-dideoxygalactose transaminase
MGKVVKGPDTEMFVQRFCNLIGVKYGIPTNLARSAFADIEEDFNIAPKSVKAHITGKTKAIIIPHLSGKPAKIEEIREITQKRGILLIEDVCQATGGKHNEQYLGTFGDVGVFSFGMGKNMMATGGGIVVTNLEGLYRAMKNIKLEDEKWSDLLRKVKFYILTMFLRKYTAPYFLILNIIRSKLSFLKPRFFDRYYGDYKLLNMSNMDASILLIQLRKLSEIIARRRANAEILCQLLSDIEELKIPRFDNEHIFTKFVITLEKGEKSKDSKMSKEASGLSRFLRHRSIEPEATYTPLHLRDGLTQYANGNLPVSESLYWRSFTLPVQPNLTQKDMIYVAEVVRQYFEGSSCYMLG